MCSGDFLTKKFILDKRCSIFRSPSQHFEVSFHLVPPPVPRRQRHIAVWPHQPQAVSLKWRAQTRLQEIGISLDQRRPSVVAFIRIQRKSWRISSSDARTIAVDRSAFPFLGPVPGYSPPPFNGLSG